MSVFVCFFKLGLNLPNTHTLHCVCCFLRSFSNILKLFGETGFSDKNILMSHQTRACWNTNWDPKKKCLWTVWKVTIKTNWVVFWCWRIKPVNLTFGKGLVVFLCRQTGTLDSYFENCFRMEVCFLWWCIFAWKDWSRLLCWDLPHCGDRPILTFNLKTILSLRTKGRPLFGVKNNENVFTFQSVIWSLGLTK